MARNITTITGTKEMLAALGLVGERAENAAKAALYQEVQKIMAASQQEAPVGADGVLRVSGYVGLPERVARGWHVPFGYGGAAKGYAAAVHEGRKPGTMPPSKALEPWVKKKLAVPTKEVPSVAFLVARKIKLRGTKPTKFLERPLLAAIPGMADRMARTIRRQVEKK